MQGTSWPLLPRPPRSRGSATSTVVSLAAGYCPRAGVLAGAVPAHLQRQGDDHHSRPRRSAAALTFYGVPAPIWPRDKTLTHHSMNASKKQPKPAISKSA